MFLQKGRDVCDSRTERLIEKQRLKSLFWSRARDFIFHYIGAMVGRSVCFFGTFRMVFTSMLLLNHTSLILALLIRNHRYFLIHHIHQFESN